VTVVRPQRLLHNDNCTYSNRLVWQTKTRHRQLQVTVNESPSPPSAWVLEKRREYYLFSLVRNDDFLAGVARIRSFRMVATSLGLYMRYVTFKRSSLMACYVLVS